MLKPEGRGFNSLPGQSFPLSLCGPNSICRANAHMVYGLKHQHFTLHSISLFVIEKGCAGGPCCVSSFRKISANACSFSTYKAMDDCHGIVKGTLAPK